MKSNLSILIFIFLIFFQKLSAQKTADSLSKAYYKEALSKIDVKDYKGADQTFKKLLKLKTMLPDELAYFYGYTLLQLNNFKSGRELLNKYISLRGDTARYFTYAKTYINFADCKELGFYFTEEICYECHGNGIASRQCSVCHGRGIEQCPLCDGLGVIKKRDNFGDTFSTCTKCNGATQITCPSCHGKLVESYRCYVCDGKGKVKIKKECDATVMGGEGEY